MISPTQLRKVLGDRSSKRSSDTFFKLHVHIEGYVKRVMLIGLRLNGCQYNNSQRIVESTYITTANLIEKVLWLIDGVDKKQGEVIADLKDKHEDFFKIKELVINYSAVYRNRLAHGTINVLNDQDKIDSLCHVNHTFFLAFEKLLKNEYGHSAFETPGSWGAKTGTNEDITKTVKRLKLGSIVKEPLSITKVHEALQGTEYEFQKQVSHANS